VNIKTVRITGAQCSFSVGAIQQNKNKILKCFEKAESVQSDIIIFPELAITGYPPEDLLLRESFIGKNFAVLEEIAEFSSVVLGFENEIITEKINFYNSNILINENWNEGILSSIRTALFFYQNQKEVDGIVFFLGDQPDIKNEVIQTMQNKDAIDSKVLIPQYRYKLGFPIFVPRQLWPKLELLTQEDSREIEPSVYKDFDLVDYFISSETKVEKLNFNFLSPTDYDEEKDF